jgi:hypothetical protein
MPEKHVVFALIERRARVAGEARVARRHVARLESELAVLDKAVRMFKPDFDPASIAPKRTFKKNPASVPKGTGSRKALDVLRESGEPLSAKDLAFRVLRTIGKDADDHAVTMLAKTIHSSFSRQKNPVVVLERNTWPGRWRLLPRSEITG